MQPHEAIPAEATLGGVGNPTGAGDGMHRDKAWTIIRPSHGWRSLDLTEFWQYRELLYFLVWRDVKVRYKQTALGALWAVLQPLSAMLVFSIFFGRLAAVPSDGLPYPLFCYVALVPWAFFANGLTHSANSLVNSQNLIKKVYFPRIAVPVAAVLAGGVDFLIAFALLIGMMAFYHTVPTANVIWLPALLLLAMVTALGVGLWLAALNVTYRDIQYVVPFLVQIWLFATPIAYPSSLLSEPWRTLYGLNPMVGVVEGFRWALLAGGAKDGLPAPSAMILVSSLAALVVFVSGVFYFRRLEKTFADVV